MANTLVSTSKITKESLRLLSNELSMAKNVNRQFKDEFTKVGNTVSVRKPVKFRSVAGASRTNQDVLESTTDVTIDKRFHVSWNFTSEQMTLTVEEFSKRYLKPAMIALANQMDSDLCDLYKDVYNMVGTPGTAPATYAALAAVGQRLDEEACPNPRNIVLGPKSYWSLVTGDFKNYFNQNVAGDLVRKAKLGDMGDLMTSKDQNIKSHTTGHFTSGATPLINDAGGAITDGDATIPTDGWDAGNNDVHEGDIFTIAGVYAVNPVSRESTGVLRQFVVTAQTDSVAGAMATLPISPTLITPAAATDQKNFATVDALPADNAALTFFGTEDTQYQQNIALHEDGMGIVCVPLEMPFGNTEASQDNYEGLSVRVVRDYDIDNDVNVIRLDVLYGVKTYYKELCCRLTA